MSAHTVCSKPLHTKVIYEAILLNILDVSRKGLIVDASIDEPERHRKSIALELAQVDARPDPLKGAKLDLLVPVPLSHCFDYHFRITAAQGDPLRGHTPLVFVPAKCKMLDLLLDPL